MEGSHLPHPRGGALNTPESPPDAVVIGLGANLGDRLATMQAAVALIGRVAPVRTRSRVYETAPVGKTDQPAFLNAAIAVICSIFPLSLLDELMRIERELGRDRDAAAVRWGPRTIDLDILWSGVLVLDNPRLVVPHPRLVERAFALAPLLDVVPGAIDPHTRAPYGLPPDDGKIRRTGLRL